MNSTLEIMDKKHIFILLTIFSNFIFGQNQYKYELKNLPFNNEYPSFGMAFLDQNTLVFSGSKNGNAFNLYQAPLSGIENNSNFEFFAKSTKSNAHETNVTFTKDKKTMYFTRSLFGKTYSIKKNTRARLAIFRAKLQENGEWGELKSMPFNSHKYDVAHPTLSNDGKLLYFSSNMPGTLGDTDIFVVDVLNDGNYSMPRNLGDKVNTAKKEQFPFISDDNFLYFSSTGHKENYGGFDIYYVKINGTSTTKAIHFEDPINSKWDDFSYITKPKSDRGYLASNRPRGKGYDDIYLVTKSLITQEDKQLVDCKQFLVGVVQFNNNADQVVPGATVILLDSNNKQVEKIQARANGKFRFTINCKENYTIKAFREDFKEGTIKITTSSIKDKKQNVNINLLKKTAAEQNLKHETAEGSITFHFNENKLNEEDKYKLNVASKIMKRNPKLIIEIESHTDSRGDDNYNLEITQKRVDVIKRFLVFCGIDSSRIKANAFGETKPINKCINEIKCSDKEHKMNRRTTYKLK